MAGEDKLSPLAAGLVSGGMGIAGGVINGAMQFAMNDINYRRAKEADRVNRERQLFDQDREMAYNSASAQVARARAAGLAPAEYSNATAFQAGAPTGFAPPEAIAPDLGTAFSHSGEEFLQAFNRQNMAVQDINVKKAQSRLMNAQAKTEEDMLEYEKAKAIASTNESIQRLENLKQDYEKGTFQIEGIKLDNTQKENIIKWFPKMQESIIAMQSQQIDLWKSAGLLNDAHVKEAEVRIEQIHISNDLTKIKIAEEEYNLETLLPLEAADKVMGIEGKRLANVYAGLINDEETMRRNLSFEEYKVYMEDEQKYLQMIRDKFKVDAKDAHFIAQTQGWRIAGECLKGTLGKTAKIATSFVPLVAGFMAAPFTGGMSAVVGAGATASAFSKAIND